VTNEGDNILPPTKRARFDSSPVRETSTTVPRTNGGSLLDRVPVVVNAPPEEKEDDVDKDIYGDVEVVKTVDTLAVMQHEMAVRRSGVLLAARLL